MENSADEHHGHRHRDKRLPPRTGGARLAARHPGNTGGPRRPRYTGGRLRDLLEARQGLVRSRSRTGEGKQQ